MSMNLAFKPTIGGPYLVEFPFQTPTSLTCAVLDTQSLEERLKLLQEYLGPDNEDVFEETEEMMRDPTLELVMI